MTKDIIKGPYQDLLQLLYGLSQASVRALKEQGQFDQNRIEAGIKDIEALLHGYKTHEALHVLSSLLQGMLLAVAKQAADGLSSGTEDTNSVLE